MIFKFLVTISTFLIVQCYASIDDITRGGCLPIELAVKQSRNDIIRAQYVSIPLELSYNIGSNEQICGWIQKIMGANPKITFVLDCGTEKHIGDKCLYTGIFSPFVCPLARVKVYGPEVESIGDQFIGLSNYLVSADLSHLTKVKKIGDNFLSRNQHLINLILPKSGALEEIGDGFLFNCSRLKNVHLKWLSTVNQIGGYFLFENQQMPFVDISPLKKNVIVGEKFLLLHEGQNDKHDFDTYTVILSEGQQDTLPIPNGYRLAFIKTA